MRSPHHTQSMLAGAARVLPLHVCERCDSPLVYPLRWQQTRDQWTVWRRCPNCEWRHRGTFDQETVDAFDEALEAGAAALARDLRGLARANLSEDVERFARALAAEAILPEDF